jgi:hypothetical protein
MARRGLNNGWNGEKMVIKMSYHLQIMNPLEGHHREIPQRQGKWVKLGKICEKHM